MGGELLTVAGKCDGVRCDMAMLVLPEVFERTWGVGPGRFGRGRPSASAHHRPAFTFMAEVYWDLEWTLQQQGFDYTYDKRLYDRLRKRCPTRPRTPSGRPRLPGQAGPFPGEPRRALCRGRIPGRSIPAAAAITFLSPGLRFFHQGQLEGARVRVPVHLCRGPTEPTDQEIATFYGKLLLMLRDIDAFRNGDWSQIDPLPAWPGNGARRVSFLTPGLERMKGATLRS